MIEYAMNVYDMNENFFLQECPVSPCRPQDRLYLLDEMNMWVADSQFSRGWGRQVFDASTNVADFDGNDFTYTGAPAIPLFAHATPNGLSISSAPAYDHGTVTYNGVEMPNYQILPSATNGESQPTCGPNNLELCQTEFTCNRAGGFWCDNTCQAEECDNGGETPQFDTPSGPQDCPESADDCAALCGADIGCQVACNVAFEDGGACAQ
jgi:hypothetical protein